MLQQLAKSYYVLEGKAMATDDLLSPPAHWDLECDHCGGDPPPFFHLPPPPAPPGLKNPLGEGISDDDCHGPWTCPALSSFEGFGGGGPGGNLFGGDGGFDGEASASPAYGSEVPKAVIAVCAIILGIFFVVAAVILINRIWRSCRAPSKKPGGGCGDLDGPDIYEDLPTAPPLLSHQYPLNTRHQLPLQGHHPHMGHPSLRYKDNSMLPPRGGLLPLPPSSTLHHLYSPEPRPETPSDHLYHHISSAGSETCSCSTSEAPSNALLPTSHHHHHHNNHTHHNLIHSEEDERSSSSSHSYSSTSTATPTSVSPTPVQTNQQTLFLCPSSMPNSEITLLPNYGSAYSTNTGNQHLTPQIMVANGGVSPSAAVYAVSSITDPTGKEQQICQNDMFPLAQIYNPGSHLYESATLLRPGEPASSSMVHWGNVPQSMLKAVNSHPTNKPNHYPMYHQPHCAANKCHKKGRNCHKQDGGYVRGSNNHIQQHYPYQNSLALPIHSSTLMPGKLAKSMHDVNVTTPTSEDLTPTNSIPINSFYNNSSSRLLDGHNRIATTCLSTMPPQMSSQHQNEYSTTADALNPASQYQHPDGCTNVSDTSSSSHPSSSNGTDGGLMVTESSSLDSSGTTASSNPSTRKDLPPLPSRVDRYRIYADSNHNNNRSQTARRPNNNNFTSDRLKSTENGNQASGSNIHGRNFKSFDDLHGISGSENHQIRDVNNLANNNMDLNARVIGNNNFDAEEAIYDNCSGNDS